MGNLKWLIVGVLVLLGVYFIMQSQQSGYTTQTDRVFPEKKDVVSKLVFEKSGATITLTKQDTTWSIVGNDTLVVKVDRIKSFFDQAFGVERETLMTQKADNWSKYSVDDALGAHVKVYDASDALLTHAVFGQSTSDWSRNYVRVGEGPEVYLTNMSVIHQINTLPTYWGEKPPAPKPVVMDSVGVGGE